MGFDFSIDVEIPVTHCRVKSSEQEDRGRHWKGISCGTESTRDQEENQKDRTSREPPYGLDTEQLENPKLQSSSC